MIKQAMSDAVRYYWEPEIIPTLYKLPIFRRSAMMTLEEVNKAEFHHNRSERRQAQVRVIQALIARLDLGTLKVGTPLPDGTFRYRSFEEIRQLSELTLSRFKRAIADLKAARLIDVTEVRVQNADGDYRSRPAIKSISMQLLLSLGISIRSLESARSYAREKYERIKRNFEAKKAKKSCGGRGLVGSISATLKVTSPLPSKPQQVSQEYLRAQWVANQIHQNPKSDLQALKHEAFKKYPD